MSPENLTREETSERSRTVSEVAYEVALDLTSPGPTFSSTTTVSFRAVPGSATWLDLIAPHLREVTLNDVPLDVDTYDSARIPLTDLAEFNTVKVVADCRYMSSGEGLHRFVDPVDDRVYLYTQFEVADCRRVMAVFEQPDIKAPLTLAVRAPAHWQVIGNRPTPLPSPRHDGSAEWRFDPTLPLPSYLYALIAGEYFAVRDHYEGPHGSYPLGLFCRTSLADALDADDIFGITKQGLAFFEETFAYPFPFGKYDQIFVPEFNAGAMENPGAVTFHEDHYIFRSQVTDAAYEGRAETILHEMAHMWFGDLVTMRWWDDLWLNESFAEWAAHHAAGRATRFTNAWASFANQRKAWAYRQDQLPSTHPIAADMVDLDAVYANFDGITYAKGASVLKQLVAYVGEASFIEGLRRYFVRHAFANTEFADLLHALEEASGKSLSAWADAWLRTAGVNLIRPEVTVVDGRYSEVVLHQEPPTAPPGLPPVLRPHRLALGLYDVVDDELTPRAPVELDFDSAAIEVGELVGQPAADLLLINDGDLTYAKIRMDGASLATAADWLSTLRDPLARALIWGAAWDMVRDAEMSTADFVALTAGALGSESDVGLVGQVLRQVSSAVSLFADPQHRNGYAAALASSLLHEAQEAPIGSDHRLAYLRGFLMFAGSGDIPTLRGLLEGNSDLADLGVDTDIRWTAVTRLVAMGSAGPESIEAQLDRDGTAAGRRRAIAARAAAPDLAAKQAAWESALDDPTLPNATLESTMSGIMQADQADLVRPFIERYFAALPSLMKTRTQEIASSIIVGLYPTLVVEQATIDRTQEFLDANPDFPPGARRLLVECADGVARSLRCVARDRTG